jgi:diadenylate cyclase
MTYPFVNQDLFELIAVGAVFIALTILFIRKRSFRLFLIYATVLALQVGAVVVHRLFYMPVTIVLTSVISITMSVALVVAYQSSIRTAFFNLTRKKKADEGVRNLSDDDLRKAVEEIVRACQSMSKVRTGALIVIAPTSIPPYILETGTRLNGLISSPLIESIFNTKGPLHDGAIMVRSNRILAAGCFLPLSQKPNTNKSLGTRHRAGIGITEESDMITIICSEETGIISVAEKGELRRFITPDRLRDILYGIFNIAQVKKTRTI